MKTITVKDETWMALKSFGKKGDTFDNIIQRLIHDYKIYVEG
jgi:predicted CopG family antitoxin